MIKQYEHLLYRVLIETASQDSKKVEQRILSHASGSSVSANSDAPGDEQELDLLDDDLECEVLDVVSNEDFRALE